MLDLGQLGRTSVERALHQRRDLSEGGADGPRHRLLLGHQRPQLLQDLVALHGLLVPFFAGDVHAEGAHGRLDVVLDHVTEVLEDEFEGVATRRHVSGMKKKLLVPVLICLFTFVCSNSSVKKILFKKPIEIHG